MFSPWAKKATKGARWSTATCWTSSRPPGWGCAGWTTKRAAEGVCARIPSADAQAIATPARRQQWCREGECLDRLMLDELDSRTGRYSCRAAPAGRGAGAAPDGQPRPGVLPPLGPRQQAFRARNVPTHVTSDCEQQDLVNVYDDSIVETDAYLGPDHRLAAHPGAGFRPGHAVCGDRGESLGENGCTCCHGLPYRIAPRAQKHVPWVLWPGTLQQRTGWSEA